MRLCVHARLLRYASAPSARMLLPIQLPLTMLISPLAIYAILLDVADSAQ